MKILLDPQIFEQRFGGISRYYTEIYKYFKTKSGPHIQCPMLFSENLHLQHYGLQPKYLNWFFRKVLQKGYLTKDSLYKKNKKLTLKNLRVKRYTIFIPTYYDTYFLDYLNSTPFVLTVYDMIHELYPQYFLNDTITCVQKKELMERASRIIAISDNTKKDIIKLYPHIQSSKITVIYLNHSIDKLKKVKPVSLMEGKKYILFVGNRYGYKNFTWFIRSVSKWLTENKFSLLCLGGNPFNEDELQLIDDLHISNRVSQYNFKDEELSHFYNHAFAFIFPSMYEGFGIPILEAMSCNCPVILPETSSFPEVAGSAGIYFQLNKPATLTDALDKLLIDDNYRVNTILAGQKQASMFSWEKTMEQVSEVYRKAIL